MERPRVGVLGSGDVGRVLGRPGQGGFAVGRRVHRVAPGAEVGHEGAQDVRLVIDDQHPAGGPAGAIA